MMSNLNDTGLRDLERETAMGDLSDDELARIEARPCCVNRPCTDYACRAAREIRRHRAALAADKERVRHVVSDAAVRVLSTPRPALDPANVAAWSDAIAELAVEQLATTGIPER